MAEVLNNLIEGFDPEKVQESEFDENWKEIYGAYQNRTVLQAIVAGIETKLDKPCATVMVGHVRGYIPLDFSGMENGRQLHTLTGKTIAFQVLSYDRDGDVFTASRKAALEQMAEITWRKLEARQTIYAVARSVTQTLVRADIGGIEVKIPKNDVSYEWIDDLTEKVKPNDHLRVKVLKADHESQTVKVSAKADLPNPWPDCIRRYETGNEYVGRVSGVREYGVFVNLEPGVDSLSQHLKFEDVQKGDKVLVRIMGANAKKEQIQSRITRVL